MTGLPSYPPPPPGAPLHPPPRSSTGRTVGIVVAVLVGVFLLLTIGVIVAVVLLFHSFERSVGPGISGPDDGCGGVQVYRAPDYHPPRSCP